MRHQSIIIISNKGSTLFQEVSTHFHKASTHFQEEVSRQGLAMSWEGVEHCHHLRNGLATR